MLKLLEASSKNQKEISMNTTNLKWRAMSDDEKQAELIKKMKGTHTY